MLERFFGAFTRDLELAAAARDLGRGKQDEGGFQTLRGMGNVTGRPCEPAARDGEIALEPMVEPQEPRGGRSA